MHLSLLSAKWGLNSQTLTIPIAVDSLEQQELLFIAGGNAKW